MSDSNLIDTVLVVWSREEGPLWAAVRQGLGGVVRSFALAGEEGDPLRHDLTGDLAEALPGETSTRMAYGPTGVERALEEAVEGEATHIAVVPLAFALESAYPEYVQRRDVSAGIRRAVKRIRGRRVTLVAPPFEDEDVRQLVREIRRQEPEGLSLLEGVVERGFRGDPQLFGRFMGRLQAILPSDARVVLRGSTLTGVRYVDGMPHDADGPGSSDIDITTISEEALVRWAPEGFYIPGVLSIPVSDEHPEYAPWLDPTRRKLQEMVGRPVTVQAMTEWFLELRTALLETPYLYLDA
jgi:hypothetical protein